MKRVEFFKLIQEERDRLLLEAEDGDIYMDGVFDMYNFVYNLIKKDQEKPCAN